MPWRRLADRPRRPVVLPPWRAPSTSPLGTPNRLFPCRPLWFMYHRGGQLLRVADARRTEWRHAPTFTPDRGKGPARPSTPTSRPTTLSGRTPRLHSRQLRVVGAEPNSGVRMIYFSPPPRPLPLPLPALCSTSAAPAHDEERIPPLRPPPPPTPLKPRCSTIPSSTSFPRPASPALKAIARWRLAASCVPASSLRYVCRGGNALAGQPDEHEDRSCGVVEVEPSNPPVPPPPSRPALPAGAAPSVPSAPCSPATPPPPARPRSRLLSRARVPD